MSRKGMGFSVNIHEKNQGIVCTKRNLHILSGFVCVKIALYRVLRAGTRFLPWDNGTSYGNAVLCASSRDNLE